METLLAFALYLAFVLLNVLIAFYAERKIAAFIQDRMGPTEVGPYGLLQPVADLLKFLQKEDIVPRAADKWLFRIAPFLIFPAVFTGFAVIPIVPRIEHAPLQTGLLFLLAIVSLDVIGILMAGWASNNKFSLFGAMRSAAQMVSYEVPLTMSLLSVVVLYQNLDLGFIAQMQGSEAPLPLYWLGLDALAVDLRSYGGILTWNIVRFPFLLVPFLVFYVTSLAECNRAPFDIPEGESEIIGGYHTEYSGFRFAIFFLAEYGMMILVSLLSVTLFFGGWHTPLPNIGFLRLNDWTAAGTSVAGTLWAVVWLSLKMLLLVFFQIVMRWTYPRLRVDQLMSLCWKVLLPIALVSLFFCTLWRLCMVLV
ncbi:NADH-quinone oxidoreductase subunit H [Thermonema lapsum]|uniref:NADH-quinone oxidoreductase subunit H n=1 Tax=Thermonema lapsum TaxID=28195 RepID=A0A846MR35_9BACT|nr:complex I subunit 1 family protein [Thermonema lapsum]NIK73919.1 NADH-quinone oxidoreductase subunit H [Thermonema lapsum]